jgi:hypothetical protein
VNNETFEDRVLTKKKSSSAKVFYVVAGLLVLGVLALYGGVKIVSNLQISADTEPPVPPDPFASAVTSAVTSAVVPTPTVTASTLPPNPPEPCTTPKTVSFPSGWSMISGFDMEGKDLADISRKNIYIYSFNDPSPNLQNRAWVTSDPFYTNSGDYLKVGSYQMWMQNFVGYYAYNPGAAVDISFNCLTSTNPSSMKPLPPTFYYGRGWHLMYWPGDVQTRDQLLSNFHIFYNDASSLTMAQAIAEAQHRASLKIYVVVNQTGIAESSVKELTGVDSDTTISKIPAKSYFWVYLRRTKSRSVLVAPLTASNTSPVPSPSTTASSTGDTPPTPPNP